MSGVHPHIKGEVNRDLVSSAGSALAKSTNKKLKSEAAGVLQTASTLIKHKDRKAPEHKGRTTAEKMTNKAHYDQASKIVHIKEDKAPEEVEIKHTPRKARGAKKTVEAPKLEEIKPVISSVVATPPSQLPEPEVKTRELNYDSLTVETTIPSQVVVPAGKVHDVTTGEIEKDQPKMTSVVTGKTVVVTSKKHAATIREARVAAKERKQHEDWSNDKQYKKGELVHYKGDIYVALMDSHHVIPATSAWYRVRRAHRQPRQKKEPKPAGEKKKRTISPEQRAKMNAGKEAARAALLKSAQKAD